MVCGAAVAGGRKHKSQKPEQVKAEAGECRGQGKDVEQATAATAGNKAVSEANNIQSET